MRTHPDRQVRRRRSARVRPDDLAATVVRELVARHASAGLDPAGIDDVLFGDANGAGEDNRDVARMAVLLAGLPDHACPARRSTGSAAPAWRPSSRRSRAIAAGDAVVILAGGVESMSRAPWVLPKPAKGFPAGHRDPALHDAGLAHGQPRDAGGVDHRPRRERRAAGRPATRSAARSRTRSRSSPPAGRRGLGRRRLRRRGGARRGHRPDPRRGHPRRRQHWSPWPGSSRCSAPTARSPRATPRR